MSMPPAAPDPGVVVFRRTGPPGDIDAIDEYSRRLTRALCDAGIRARYADDGLRHVANAATRPPWVLLQYNPFRFGPRGIAPHLLVDALQLRRRGVPLIVMVHEAWVGMHDWRSALMGSWQRAQLRALLHAATATLTSTEALATRLGRAIHVPVATNITPVPMSHDQARQRLGLNGELVVALLGRAHESRALDHAEAAVGALASVRGTDQLKVFNLGKDAPGVQVPAGVEVYSPGEQTNDALSIGLTASDLVLLPFVEGISTRRTTLMASLAHGLAIVGSWGADTDSCLLSAADALVLTPPRDRLAYANAAATLASDSDRMRALGVGARRLYEARFDWPILAGRVGEVLNAAVIGSGGGVA
jgi:glycosyltransferase involved in cell wall biosynthesis